MKIKKKNIVAILVFMVIFTISAYIRKPFDGEGFSNSDATYHVLLTMQAYDETSSSIHNYLPIQTYGEDYNKFIENGPSLLQDKFGNSFYVSFSPMGFYVPYFFCKLLNLDLSINSLYIFNCLLMLISAIIIGYIVYHLFKTNSIAFIVMIIYIFLPEILYTQGIVYWHHSLSQIFLSLQILLFILIFINKRKNAYLKLLFFIISFLYPYLEWTGFISNIGMALGIFLIDFKIEKNDEKKRGSLSIDSVFYILSLALTTSFALVYYIFRFTSIASVNEIINTMKSRAEARSEASFLGLITGYLDSYMPIIIFIFIIFLIGLMQKQSRHEMKNIFTKKVTWITIVVMLFPLLENLIMMEHAILYTFDRLKFSLFLIYLMSIGLYALKKVGTKIYLFISVLCVPITAILGLNLYSDGRIKYLDEYSDTIAMKNYLEKDFLDDGDSILVKDGWRAWGFLQTLYHRNIYCTAIYPNETLIDIANKLKKKYIINLELTSEFGDTSCYTKAMITDINSSNIYHLYVEDGIVNINDVNDVYVANLTDENWSKGILNSNKKEILFNNIINNYVKLKNAKKINCGDETFNILNVESDSLWIRVSTDRDATSCAYPNALQVE